MMVGRGVVNRVAALLALILLGLAMPALPRLKPGVIVHVHDIYLPDDYISGHLRQLWNEQYLLATALLFGGERFEVLFPCWWAGRDPELRVQARAAVCQGPLESVDLYGASFWMRVR